METHNYDMIDFELVRLEQGEKFTLTTNCMPKKKGNPADILWTSDNESVAAVDKNGVITAAGLGSAVIAASLHGECAECLIHVIEKQFSFNDVSEEDWYYEAVRFVADNGLMNGQGKNTFAPDALLTRAQFVIILYRMSGSPKVEYVEKYSDVPAGKWYTDAILWASNAGIVGGYGDSDLFGPNDNINREQMAIMMYRYAGYRGYNISEKADLSSYKDTSDVSTFAKEAVAWALGSGILTGKESGTLLAPMGPAIRCECAMTIMRFIKKYENPEKKEQ